MTADSVHQGAGAPVPAVMITQYHRATGIALSLDEPGPWQLTGTDYLDREIITTHDGPIDYVARKLLAGAYPTVKAWQARPAQIDETYRRHDLAAHRISQLLGVRYSISAAILAIVADPVLGHRYVHGKWEVTGDDDDQTFRIRAVELRPDHVLRPDHDPGPDCPNAPHTCLICQPKVEAAAITRRLGPRSGNNPN